MSVVVLTNLYPNPLEPGRSTFNEQLVCALNQEMPVAATIVPIDWKRALQFFLSGKRAILKACTDWKGIPVCYPVHAYIPRIGRWLNGPLMFFALLPSWLRISRVRPTAILAIWAYPEGFAAVLLALVGRQRVVVRVIGSDVEILATEFIRRKLAIWALNRADHVVSVCGYLKDRLVALGVRSENIDVVYEGVDRERFFPRDRNSCRQQLGLEGEKQIILYVGNLKFDKGPVDLLKAVLPLLKSDANSVEIYFLGDGPVRVQLEEMVAHEQVESDVHILGRVAHELIPIWMNAVDVICLPSHHEGIPNVIVEATACGVPCVATAVGGIPEVLSEKNGYLVPLGDSEALLDSLRRCLAKTWDRDTIQSAIITGTWQESARKIAVYLKAD